LKKMQNPLKQLLAKLKPSKPISSLLSPEQEAELRREQDKLNKPPRSKGKGRVVKQARSVEFNPIPSSGGRVVKVMPRQLQKIKQAQEKVSDD
jgi:hypothetical protein